MRFGLPRGVFENVCQSVGLQNGTSSQDYIQLLPRHGNPRHLAIRYNLDTTFELLRFLRISSDRNRMLLFCTMYLGRWKLFTQGSWGRCGDDKA